MVSPELHAAWVECGRCCALEHWAGIIEAAEVGEQFPTSPRWRGVARRRHSRGRLDSLQSRPQNVNKGQDPNRWHRRDRKR